MLPADRVMGTGGAGGARLALLLWICILGCCGPLWGASSEQLKQSIKQEKGKVQQRQDLLQRLSSEERTLYGNLAAIEDRMAALERGLEQQEQELQRITQEADALAAEFGRVERRQNETVETLRTLLASLWPVHLSSVQNQLYAYSTWAEAERQFTWMSAIYHQVEQALHDLERQNIELSANIEAQEQAKTKLLAKVQEVEKGKDALLSDRLVFLSRVQEVRARKLETEEHLQQVLSAIESMQYELKALTNRSFEGFQGHLPWPVSGKVISGFDTSAEPPRRGIGLALNGPAPIGAVSWGKVVHNDQLRGFGQVVILTHGNDFYTLYAFLSEAPVKVGQNVERGEIIGKAGYYPQAKGPGLYFELRSGPKAVNPLLWLSSVK
jgi:murein hydrolase activator